MTWLSASRIVAPFVTVALLAGCSAKADSELSASDPTFAGLDSEVTKEVLASPVAEDRVAGDDPAVASARYQGIVRNFVLCRDAYASYKTWLKSGESPGLPRQPNPTNPAPTAGDMEADIKLFRDDLDSGDISLVRERLSSANGCGGWIPATPGDLSGQTIADAVKAGR